jgi:hypothetical protein
MPGSAIFDILLFSGEPEHLWKDVYLPPGLAGENRRFCIIVAATLSAADRVALFYAVRVIRTGGIKSSTAR